MKLWTQKLWGHRGTRTVTLVQSFSLLENVTESKATFKANLRWAVFVTWRICPGAKRSVGPWYIGIFLCFSGLISKCLSSFASSSCCKVNLFLSRRVNCHVSRKEQGFHTCRPPHAEAQGTTSSEVFPVRQGSMSAAKERKTRMWTGLRFAALGPVPDPAQKGPGASHGP